ncbi:trypsin-like peptidase domain-containing protein [Sandaracinus amylolyticus]|uniref:trypsin-like peptidase domain-containing protein n=1 Tax=Sandaracinus amylolyticus TaxID=927083 RepID=UPI001F39DBD6|nr:trypsin-like peptidase domain-containing protein [Sandaracinus amylolyticus]UJR79008.1 Transcriptional regulator [Sandaracinus amylolyticus]
MSRPTNAATALTAVLALASLGLAGTTFYLHQQQSEELARLRAEAAQRPPTLPGTPTPPPVRAPLPAAADVSSASMADVVERVLPAVVNIATTRGGVRGGSPYGPTGGHGADSLGSGVIVDAGGLVVTNHHVVASGGTILVTLSDGHEYPATIVGADPQTDMALLRLQGVEGPLTPIPYGDSSQLRQGDVVLAIGNPFGVGQTVTMGIVSATGRADMGIAEYEDFVQTDAAINPGNSGGALISMRGELVGINTAILSRTGGSHGIGFSIPSNMLRPIVESLLRHGKVVRGWLGVTIQDITPDLASAMGLDAPRGVIVTGIEPGSPAEQAGVARGDRIERLDAERLLSSAQLRNLVATRGAGARIQLAIARGGDRRTLEVALGERPPVALQAPVAPTVPPQARTPDPRGLPFGLPPGLVPGVPGLNDPSMGAQPSVPRDLRGADVGGLQVVDLDTRVRAMLGIPADVRAGAVVVALRPGSSGEQAGLQPGDVVVEVNRTPVSGVAQLQHEYARAGGNAVLLVRRGAASLYVLMR